MATATGGEDLSARILAPLLRYVAETRGDEALAALLAGSAPRARNARAWLTHAEFERVLAAARELLGSDEALYGACAHRMARGYGPMALVLRAVSVERVYALMTRTIQLVSRVSAFEMADLGGSQVWLRYTSPLAESRLMCLSRRAQLAAAPTLSGLAPATLDDLRCIGRGDPCCEYVARW